MQNHPITNTTTPGQEPAHRPIVTSTPKRDSTIGAFRAMIDDADVTPAQEMNYLRNFTKGEVQNVVDNFRKRHHTDLAVVLRELWRELERRFGNTAAITNVLLERLTHAANFRLSCLNYPNVLRPIVERLPNFLRSKWEKEIISYATKHQDAYPGFHVFASMAQEQANKKNHPNVQASGVQPTVHGEKSSKITTKQELTSARRVMKTNTEEDNKPHCKFHDCDGHELTECKAFATKSIQEKTDWILKEKLCFRCLEAGHIAKEYLADKLKADGPRDRYLLSTCSDKAEIPTPEIAGRFSHLRDIVQDIPPLDDQAKIHLLIGRDAPELLKVRAFKNGPRGAPWAQKLVLGWTISGQARLDFANRPVHIQARRTTVMGDNDSYARTDTLVEMPPGVTDSNEYDTVPCPNKFIVTDNLADRYTNDLKNDVFHSLPSDSEGESKFLKVMEAGIHKNNIGNWEMPLPFRQEEVRLPNDRNPADLETRGLHPSKMMESVWLNGPTFLRNMAEVPPSNEVMSTNDSDPEVRKEVTSCKTKIGNSQSSGLGAERFKRFSSLSSLRRALANLIVKIREFKLRKERPTKPTIPGCNVPERCQTARPPNADELEHLATVVILLATQREAYGEELQKYAFVSTANHGQGETEGQRSYCLLRSDWEIALHSHRTPFLWLLLFLEESSHYVIECESPSVSNANIVVIVTSSGCIVTNSSFSLKISYPDFVANIQRCGTLASDHDLLILHGFALPCQVHSFFKEIFRSCHILQPRLHKSLGYLWNMRSLNFRSEIFRLKSVAARASRFSVLTKKNVGSGDEIGKTSESTGGLMLIWVDLNMN
ncbi:hypothetical protein QZH41_000591 [Actinostola sp. cb2023]|nr:hypothetical protein QZH41_000591 [Actinostola sp. cb2023]